MNVFYQIIGYWQIYEYTHISAYRNIIVSINQTLNKYCLYKVGDKSVTETLHISALMQNILIPHVFNIINIK